MRFFRSAVRATALILAVALLAGLSATAWAVGEKPEEPSIYAKAAVVMDYDTGELLYAKDPDTMRVPASMTKVMTAYIVYEELAKGSFTMDTQVSISNNAANKSRDKANYEMVVPLPYGGTVPVGTLLRLMLIYSASASAIALGEFISGTEEAFVQRMNETASLMGLSATYVNTHGHMYNYITPRSQAELVRRFIRDYPEVLEITSEESVVFNGQEYTTTNHLLAGQEYSFEGVDGFKTGSTNPAGYCQATTCVRNGKRLISVVMASSSGTTRATDSVKLLKYGYAMVEYLGKYSDISTHWSRPAVEALDNMGVELHADGPLFSPDDEVTRAEFTAMLYTALELRDALPGVSDRVPSDSAYAVDSDTAAPDSSASTEAGGAELTGTGTAETDGSDTTVTDGTDTDVSDGSDTATTDGTSGTVDDITVACPFTDIEGSWASVYIASAWSLGLVNGDNGLFRPDDPITRQEIMVIIDRALKLPDGNGLNFKDVADIAFWALQSAARVTYAGLFTGNEGMLSPLAHTTRAESAQIVARIVDSL